MIQLQKALLTKIKKLNKREKIAISAGVVCVVLILFFYIVLKVFDKLDELQQKAAGKQEILTEMKALRLEYLSVKATVEQSSKNVDKRPAGFTLFSFLDKLAGATNLKDHITYMKPSSSVNEESGLKISRVEMKLQGITIEDLTSYLYRVETSENVVVVNGLSITKTGQEQGLISAVLQVETIDS